MEPRERKICELALTQSNISSVMTSSAFAVLFIYFFFCVLYPSVLIYTNEYNSEKATIMEVYTFT